MSSPLTNTYVNIQKLLDYMTGASGLYRTADEVLQELEYYLTHLPEDAKLKKENTDL